MRPPERRSQILQLLRQNGFVSVIKLSRQLDVSQMTIRRDLADLQAMGLLSRHHGGASLASERGDTEWPLILRESDHLEQKQKIGKLAASYVQGGDVVILDGGSTTLQVARHLAQGRLTVMTNCLPILSLLATSPNVNLMATGGTFYRDNQCFIGPGAVNTLKSVNANIAFMGTTGLSLKHGMSNRKIAEAEVKRAMIEAAEKIILVMDSSKMNTYTLATVGPIEAIDILVTDERLSAEDKTAIESRGVEVVIALD